MVPALMVPAPQYRLWGATLTLKHPIQIAVFRIIAFFARCGSGSGSRESTNSTRIYSNVRDNIEAFKQASIRGSTDADNPGQGGPMPGRGLSAKTHQSFRSLWRKGP